MKRSNIGRAPNSSDFGTLDGLKLDSTKNIQTVDENVPGAIKRKIVRDLNATLRRQVNSSEVSFKNSRLNNEQIGVFVSSFTSSTDIVSYISIGVYKENSFDYFTITDSSRYAYDVEFFRVDVVDNQISLTYKMTIYRDSIESKFEKMFFKDTLNQIIWERYRW